MVLVVAGVLSAVVVLQLSLFDGGLGQGAAGRLLQGGQCKEHHQNRHTLGQGIETSGRSSVKRNICPIVWPYLPIAKYPVPGPTHKVSDENLKDQG
jgi:hypothetical protein